MTKNYSLLLMTGAFLIASCNKSPAPPQSADTVAEADTTAVAAAAPTESAAAAAAKAAHVIKPGKYRVCQDDGQSGHGDFVGSHLKVGQKVEIGEFGANATKVCFKKDCPPVGSDPPESEVKVMWLGGVRTSSRAKVRSTTKRKLARKKGAPISLRSSIIRSTKGMCSTARKSLTS